MLNITCWSALQFGKSRHHKIQFGADDNLSTRHYYLRYRDIGFEVKPEDLMSGLRLFSARFLSTHANLIALRH